MLKLYWLKYLHSYIFYFRSTWFPNNEGTSSCEFSFLRNWCYLKDIKQTAELSYFVNSSKFIFQCLVLHRMMIIWMIMIGFVIFQAEISRELNLRRLIIHTSGKIYGRPNILTECWPCIGLALQLRMVILHWYFRT